MHRGKEEDGARGERESGNRNEEEEEMGEKERGGSIGKEKEKGGQGAAFSWVLLCFPLCKPWSPAACQQAK